MTTHIGPIPLITEGPVGLDIETTYTPGEKVANPFQNRIVSIQVSDGKDVWICSDPDQFKSCVPLLESDTIKVIHNSVFDLQFLIHHLGAKPNKNSLWDSLLVDRILAAGMHFDHDLASVVARRLGIFLDKETRDTFANHQGPLSEKQIDYISHDVLYLPKIRQLQLQDAERDMLGRVVGLENRILTAVARMSLAGVRFDTKMWKEYIPGIQQVMEELEGRVNDVAKTPVQFSLYGNPRSTINLASPDQVVAIFKKLKIKLDTSNRNDIAIYIENNPDTPYEAFLRDIVEWRTWRHTLSAPYADSINPVTGRVHCNWNQIQADTGRFSSSDPNMQNVDRPKPDRPNMRLLFLPEEGYRFVIADYSQQEPRIFAQISGDELLRKACRETDVYLALAETIDGKKYDRKDPRRQDIKTGVLAALYGAGDLTLASRMGISLEAAQAFLNTIDTTFAQARRWTTRNRDAAIHSGKTRTLLGRVRYFPEFVESKKASAHLASQIVNTPIQGSGADMLKLAIDKFEDVCLDHNYDAKVALALHDELVVQVREDQAEEVYYQLIGSMEAAGHDLCPDIITPVEGAITERWNKV